MSGTLKHAFTSPVVDDGNPDEVGPDEWNAAHVQDAAGLIGKTTGAGASEVLTASEAKAFLAITGDDVTGADLSRVDDTNVTLTLGGTPTGALLKATSITVGWTGTLAAARGGWGADISAQSGIPIFTTGVAAFFAPAAGVQTFLTTPSSTNLASAVTDETGSGALVFATSPSLVTPSLGVASATSINKVALTAPATAATLTIADGKTLTASNTLTFTGTDASSVAFGAGGTVAYTGGTLGQFAATTSAALAGVISDETGSGALVFGTSPTLTTSLLLGSGFVVNWGAGDVTLTHGSNNLAFAGATAGYTFDNLSIFGHTASVAVEASDPLVQSHRTNGWNYAAYRWSADATGAHMIIVKSRGASPGTNTIVQSGDEIGGIEFKAGDGTNYITAAEVSAEIDGTPGASDMPGRLLFRTTADGASAVTTRLILDSTGVLKPATDGGVALGTSALRYENLFMRSTTSAATSAVGENIQTSTGAHNRNGTVTLTLANPCVATLDSHGFTVGSVTTAGKFTTTGALPASITSGTTYYLKAIDANTFNIATSVANALAGTFISTNGQSQSGTHTVDIRVNMATDTAQNIAAISLTAGDWEITGQTLYVTGATTTVTYIAASISTTSATYDRTVGRAQSLQYGGLTLGATEFTVFSLGPVRISLAATTTVYIVAISQFGTSTVGAAGYMRARRVR